MMLFHHAPQKEGITIGDYLGFLNQSLSLSDRAMQYDSNDLANSQTPHFASQTLSFRDQLAQALARNPADVSSVQGTVVTEPGALSPDGSSVDLTAVMVNLTQNQETYGLAAQALQMQQTTVQTVINTTTP